MHDIAILSLDMLRLGERQSAFGLHDAIITDTYATADVIPQRSIGRTQTWPTIDTGTVPPPSKFLALTELPRALFELSSLAWTTPWLMAGPKGDGHPVLVLPGFVTTDVSTGILRRFLSAKGYEAHSWNLGRNLGPRAIGREGEKLIARLEEVHALTGEKVSLVGWSLGGVMARLLANWRPDLVRQVITLGSPFGGDPKASNVWRTYEALTGDRIESDHTTQAARSRARRHRRCRRRRSSARATASSHGRTAAKANATTTDNIEVYGSHIGLGVNPAVLNAIADRLAQPEGRSRPSSARGSGGSCIRRRGTRTELLALSRLRGRGSGEGLLLASCGRRPSPTTTRHATQVS